MTVDTDTPVGPRDHVVLFYRDDDELVTTVAEYLSDGLTTDECCVVVATSDHIAAFESVLARAGVDVAAAHTGGRFLTVDATVALPHFLVGDWPDAAAFGAEVGSLIQSAADTGQTVRVYGEMVALLWDAGHVAAAIEVEALWNELGQRVDFSLLCAYPAPSVTDRQDDSFHLVCDAHSAVIGAVASTEASRPYAGELNTLRPVRQFVTDTLSSWNLSRCVDDALVVVSELATNAIIHARCDFVVSLTSLDDAVRVSVSDSSPTEPVQQNPAIGATSGRGLLLISAMAQRWGTDMVGDGKVVWAELSV